MLLGFLLLRRNTPTRLLAMVVLQCFHPQHCRRPRQRPWMFRLRCYLGMVFSFLLPRWHPPTRLLAMLRCFQLLRRRRPRRQMSQCFDAWHHLFERLLPRLLHD